MRRWAPSSWPNRLPGWLYGSACVIYSRAMSAMASTSLRLIPAGDEGIRVETPITETGAGMHTALREMVARQLGSTGPTSRSWACRPVPCPATRASAVAGSRAGWPRQLTSRPWRNRLRDEPIVVDVELPIEPRVGSYLVQIAQVAVDPETGELKVLKILSVADVAEIINPLAHQMQIDGGMAMGFGQACLEDLDESQGQIWAANMGDYRLPTVRDVPRHKTVLVPGGVGVGSANVKNIGEQTTPPAGRRDRQRGARRDRLPDP